MSKKLTEWEHRVRFLDGFERSENGCWIWSGALNHAGYALFHSCIDGVMFELGHRYSFVFHKGPIPDGHILRHSCDERRCVNPGHVLSGTHADNVADRKKRWRTQQGTAHYKARLTEDQVLEIFDDKESSDIELGKKYGTDQANIYRIRRGRVWKSVLHKHGRIEDPRGNPPDTFPYN